MRLHQREITTDMGIPTEIAADGFHAVVTPASPAIGIPTGSFQSLLKRTGIGDIH